MTLLSGCWLVAFQWISGADRHTSQGGLLAHSHAQHMSSLRNPAQQEPVWAGKAVNYAAKAAQGADRDELIVTGSVWDVVQGNDYLAVSCPCGTGPSLDIWADTVIERLPDGDIEAQGRVLTASWCDTHGEDYCAAVLEGKRKRDDTKNLQASLQASQMRGALRAKAQTERMALNARRRGLAS